MIIQNVRSLKLRIYPHMNVTFQVVISPGKMTLSGVSSTPSTHIFVLISLTMELLIALEQV